MEENFYHSAFEDLIKEKADQYKMYPSDKVWKGIDRSLRSRRRWYWSGFIVLLSGISYFTATELMSPKPLPTLAKAPPAAAAGPAAVKEFAPFTSSLGVVRESAPQIRRNTSEDAVLSGIDVEDGGDITASFEIPLRFLDPAHLTTSTNEKASLRISGLKPLARDEQYNIELSWPVAEPSELPALKAGIPVTEEILSPDAITTHSEKNRINWLQEQVSYRLPAPSRSRHISWQLAFSPTVNYRKLTGGKNRISSTAHSIPLALRIEGDVNNLVNHRPALGFELGTHALLPLGKNLILKGGVQFNYSKYDIRAYKTPGQLATIALNSSTGANNGGSLVSYTDIGNFGGLSVQELKNQYYQLSLPVGLELKLFGNDRLAMNVASTIQPTYLLNRNTYLITTDYKNYTKEPSLVRRWNVNAGAEAFISYSRGDVKWQFGPQFRYQLLSSYENVYPIKEYLMEYGIKIGITKTIR